MQHMCSWKEVSGVNNNKGRDGGAELSGAGTEGLLREGDV